MPAVWYPGCKVRIQVRFEDYLDLPPIAAPPLQPGAEAFGLGAEHPFPTGAFLSTGFDIIPYSCTVERNSYRKADTCRMEIPFARLPFDPRIIRSLTLQVFGGVFSAAEYADAVGPTDSTGLLLTDSIPADRPLGGMSQELFRGFSDNIRLRGNKETARLEISGRDLTAIVIDNEVPPNAVRDIPGDLPLDILIQQILFGDGIPNSPRRLGLPGVRGLVVVNEATDPIVFDPVTGEVFEREPLPPVSDFKGPQWLDSKRSAKKGRKMSPGSSHKVSYWDLITDICVSAGFICYIRTPKKPIALPGGGAILPAAELVISRPRTYYEGRGQVVPSTGNPVPQRRKYIYGINMDDFDIDKKFAGTHIPIVEVRSYDVVTGKPIKGRYPPVPDIVPKRTNRPSVTGLADHQEVKVFVLDELNFGQGTTTTVVAKFLEDAARSIYEQLGRGETKIVVKTTHMNGFEANFDTGAVADNFLLEAGDPIEIELAVASPEEGQINILTSFEGQAIDGRTQAYIAAGVSPAAAALAAAASLSPKLQKQYRTERVIFGWDHQKGWEFEISGINYLDVRDAAEDASELAGIVVEP